MVRIGNAKVVIMCCITNFFTFLQLFFTALRQINES